MHILHTHTQSLAQWGRLPTHSLEHGACAGVNTELSPSLAALHQRHGTRSAPAHAARFPASTKEVRDLFQTRTLVPARWRRSLNQWKGLEAWTLASWLRQLYTRLCSTGEERIFCPDAAGNESKDEESCFLVPASAFSCSEGSPSLGTEHSKVNSRVNGRNREGAEVFSR